MAIRSMSSAIPAVSGVGEPEGPGSALVPVHAEPRWWCGHSLAAVTVIVLLITVTAVPYVVMYLQAPPGYVFVGVIGDGAQHEVIAADTAIHLRWQNLLTPEPTPRGWFISVQDLLLGVVQRATGIPYWVLKTVALSLVCAPALAFALMTLARRAGLKSPGIAAIVALLAGPLTPLLDLVLRIPARLGLHELQMPTSWPAIVSIGHDATPILTAQNGTALYLLLAVLVLVALPTGDPRDPIRGFRWGGVALAAMAAIYPFFAPTLGLTAVLYAALRLRHVGWRATLRGLGWLGAFSALPILYWVGLRQVDEEYAIFAAHIILPVLSPAAVLASLGLGTGALIGAPRLLRGNCYQQLLACFTVAFVTMLYLPAHPWRPHLFYLSPVLVLAALAAWWPLLAQLPRETRWIVTGGTLAAATISIPFYWPSTTLHPGPAGPPWYLVQDDVAAIQWLADQGGDDVVLAREYVSAWVAAYGHHRVVVGHGSWTHDYDRRLQAVDAVFDGEADPVPLLRAEEAVWVLIDGDSPVPAWAQGVEPAARFGQTAVLRADQLLQHLEVHEPRPPKPPGL